MEKGVRGARNKFHVEKGRRLHSLEHDVKLHTVIFNK